MIRVKIIYNDDMQVTRLKVSGHANFSESGSDIVCAGVSSIIITNLNYAEANNIGAFSIVENEKKGYMDISIDEHAEVLEHLLAAIVYGLESLRNEYSNYIKITKLGGVSNVKI